MGAVALLATLAAAKVPPAETDFGLYVDRVPTPAELRANFTGAKHEPVAGCLLGAYIDLDFTLTETIKDATGRVRRLPAPFEALTGKPHATYFFYMGYGSRLATDWVTQLGQENKIVHIALEPNNGLEYVRDDAYLTALARQLGQTKVPIFLRFASEMNGPWVKYSGDAALYREKFRLVAQVMRREAPNVAMVWAPYATPQRTIPNYYPGDAYVDWVGVNIYSVTYFNQDRRQPGANVHPVDLLDHVYRLYASRKPIMVGEFGVTHWSAVEQASTEPFARRMLRGFYEALPRVYPRVKCINYFNANNMELAHRRNNNYAITQNPNLLKTYQQIIQNPYFLSAPEPAFDGQLFLAGVEAVSPEITPLGPQPPVRPMPMRNGEVLSGAVMLSGWIRDPQDRTTLRFRINGRGLHVGRTKDQWSVELDTRRLPTGPARLELLAERGGRVVAQRAVQVSIQRAP